MKTLERRRHSPEFKLSIVSRIEAGESPSALAAELSLKREMLYRWRDAYRLQGELAFSDRLGRRTVLEAQRVARAERVSTQAQALDQARRRIAELERKVGQQAVELDFFQGALRRIKGSRPLSE